MMSRIFVDSSNKMDAKIIVVDIAVLVVIPIQKAALKIQDHQ